MNTKISDAEKNIVDESISSAQVVSEPLAIEDRLLPVESLLSSHRGNVVAGYLNAKISSLSNRMLGVLMLYSIWESPHREQVRFAIDAYAKLLSRAESDSGPSEVATIEKFLIQARTNVRVIWAAEHLVFASEFLTGDAQQVIAALNLIGSWQRQWVKLPNGVMDRVEASKAISAQTCELAGWITSYDPSAKIEVRKA